jgi:hypothetical protein
MVFSLILYSRNEQSKYALLLNLPIASPRRSMFLGSEVVNRSLRDRSNLPEKRSEPVSKPCSQKATPGSLPKIALCLRVTGGSACGLFASPLSMYVTGMILIRWNL